MNVTNDFLSNKLICNDTDRLVTTACTMKCKALPNDSSFISIQTISTPDFNQSNCILDLNMENNSFSYSLQIPINHYLIYFSKWTASNFNFSCFNSTEVISSQMLCRYEVDEYPVQSFQCPSQNITSRYISPGKFVSTYSFANTIF